MIRSLALATLFVASTAVASAQIAPPPGAVTNQGTKTYASPKPKASKMPMKGKSMHGKPMMMHGAKASPTPKS